MVVRSEGWLYFCNDCKSDSIRCNGRGKQGKDALSVCAQGLCKDAKPTKHTQTLAIRKASGIVRFLKGWCGARDGAKKAVTVGVAAAVKHSCITFNECRKLNI